MKKKVLSALVLAAIVLTTGCGEGEESSAPESISDSSLVSQEESTTTSTESTTTSTDSTTTTAQEEQSEPDETSGSTSDTASDIIDEPSSNNDLLAMEGQVTIAEELPLTLYNGHIANGDVIAVVDENRDIKAYRTNGELLNEYAYDNARVTSDGCMVLYRSESLTSPDGTPYEKPTVDVYNAEGELLYTDISEYSPGVKVNIEVSSFDVLVGYNSFCYKYTFTNAETGEEIYSFDELEWVNSGNSSSIVTYVSCQYSDYLYFTTSETSVHKSNIRLIISKDGVIDLREKLQERFPSTYPLYIQNPGSDITIDNYVPVIYGIDEDGVGFAAETEKVLYDIDNDRIIKFGDPDVDFVWNEELGMPASIIEKHGIVFYQGNTVTVTKKDGTELLSGLKNFNYNHADEDIFYISDGEKSGFYDAVNNKTYYYDNASGFIGDYAFVIENGMGHFINKNFETVSSDIPAEKSVLYNGNIIYLSAQNKLYSYTASEQ